MPLSHDSPEQHLEFYSRCKVPLCSQSDQHFTSNRSESTCCAQHSSIHRQDSDMVEPRDNVGLRSPFTVPCQGYEAPKWRDHLCLKEDCAHPGRTQGEVENLGDYLVEIAIFSLQIEENIETLLENSDLLRLEEHQVSQLGQLLKRTKILLKWKRPQD